MNSPLNVNNISAPKYFPQNSGESIADLKFDEYGRIDFNEPAKVTESRCVGIIERHKGRCAENAAQNIIVNGYAVMYAAVALMSLTVNGNFSPSIPVINTALAIIASHGTSAVARLIFGRRKKHFSKSSDIGKNSVEGIKEQEDKFITDVKRNNRMYAILGTAKVAVGVLTLPTPIAPLTIGGALHGIFSDFRRIKNPQEFYANMADITGNQNASNPQTKPDIEYKPTLREKIRNYVDLHF